MLYIDDQNTEKSNEREREEEEESEWEGESKKDKEKRGEIKSNSEISAILLIRWLDTH